jgi:hypothetical protein
MLAPADMANDLLFAGKIVERFPDVALEPVGNGLDDLVEGERVAGVCLQDGENDCAQVHGRTLRPRMRTAAGVQLANNPATGTVPAGRAKPLAQTPGSRLHVT